MQTASRRLHIISSDLSLESSFLCKGKALSRDVATGTCDSEAYCSMALRAIATRVRMAAPKERVPKEGPTAWLTDRRVVPLVPEGASGGAKYLQIRRWQLKSQG